MGVAWLLAFTLTHASAQETGSISGRVFDASNGRQLMGASVVVVGSGAAGASDTDGRFAITDIPPGEYEVRASKPLYGAAVVENVVVKGGESTDVRFSLTPKADAGIEVLDVTADIKESSEATQLLKRKMAPTVSDNLGAESISKTPDSDAAEVVTRVPSVTIKDGSFLVVRGLGDRYNAALMNRGRLPSTDPTRRVVPLDLFPADFIESLTLVKSYTPDLPGDFAGGLLDIRLTDPPLEPTASFGISTSVNTATTFDSFGTYEGCGASDWFGFGVHCRELAGGFPTREELINLNSTGTDLQQRQVASTLPLNWNVRSKTAPPNFGADLSLGNSWGPVGVNLAATYGTSHQFRNESSGVLKNEGSFIDYGYERSTFETTLGGILTSAYRLSTDHRFNFRAVFNRSSEDETLVATRPGLEENIGILFPTNTRYTADQLAFAQITSQHHLGPVDIDLLAAFGTTTRDTPDSKLTVRRVSDESGDTNEPPALLFGGASGSGRRFFSKLDETLQEYSADVSYPYGAPLPLIGKWAGRNTLFKSGASYLTRNRDFKLRQFNYRLPGPIINALDPTQITPDGLFGPQNIGRAGFRLTPSETPESARFRASQEIAAGYLMVDLPIIENKLRLITGARVEYSYIFVIGAVADGPLRRPIQDLDILPAANLVYSLGDRSNLRLAYSKTVSRPEFRELNLALLPTAPGERAFRGNPDLISSSIQNFDIRWEFFPSALELVSFGFFYKDLENPIELSAIPAATTVIETRTNAEKATAWGIEFESRKNFNFLVPLLRRWEPIRPYISFLADVELTLNTTFVESEVSGLLPVRGFDLTVTNQNRPLTDQAPFIVNAALQYDSYRWGTFRALYNTVGETIVAAGTSSGPAARFDDIVSKRRDQVDFVWLRNWEVFGQRLKTKLSIENITNDDFTETQDLLAPEGSESAGPLTTFVTNRYHEGVTLGLSLTYDF